MFVDYYTTKLQTINKNVKMILKGLKISWAIRCEIAHHFLFDVRVIKKLAP
jgi:hypothetical protein